MKPSVTQRLVRLLREDIASEMLEACPDELECGDQDTWHEVHNARVRSLGLALKLMGTELTAKDEVSEARSWLAVFVREYYDDLVQVIVNTAYDNEFVIEEMEAES